MTPTKKASYRIFSLAGIGVYVHWSWFLVALYSIQYRTHEYAAPQWNVLEYLALFAIVLTHEFGHQLACRQVGGQTHDIVLWPLGGVAYVSPPERPGAQLWSIAAGPMVNVVFAPLLVGVLWLSAQLGWQSAHPDAFAFLRNVAWMNLGLLIFNLMPVFPLDGGQILRSLLWFAFGRAKSLKITSVLGFAGVVWFLGMAIWARSIWLGIMAGFLLMNCWRGYQHALLLSRAANPPPPHTGAACPVCRVAPPVGKFWLCGKCGKSFDTFVSGGTCPFCETQFNTTRCPYCGVMRPMKDWQTLPSSVG